jgi:hypothetical protein
MTFKDILLSWMARRSTAEKIFLLADLAEITGFSEKRALSLMLGIYTPTHREIDIIATAFGVSEVDFYHCTSDSPVLDVRSDEPIVTMRVRNLICQTCKRKADEKCGFCRLKEAFDLAERIHEGMDTAGAIESAEEKYFQELEEITEGFDSW